MYVVEAIAKIRCCQGKFLKGKKELKNWITCMRQKYNRLRRDIDKGRCKDNLMKQMERKKLLESTQSLEVTLARFCLNAGWPGYASTMLLRLAKSIEIDDVNDVDEMKLNLVEQKPELQLAPEVDRRATNRWKGQGGNPQPRINIVI